MSSLGVEDGIPSLDKANSDGRVELSQMSCCLGASGVDRPGFVATRPFDGSTKSDICWRTDLGRPCALRRTVVGPVTCAAVTAMEGPRTAAQTVATTTSGGLGRQFAHGDRVRRRHPSRAVGREPSPLRAALRSTLTRKATVTITAIACGSTFT